MPEAPDANTDDLASCFRELDRVREAAFARAERAERQAMNYAARMRDYEERLAIFALGLGGKPRRPRRMRAAP
jgi:hypothetical protein